jgi:hypothetical protein
MRNEDRTESAVLFIPDDARAFLQGRIAEYGSANLGNRRRPDVERFESIETIEAAASESLFVGLVDFADGRAAWELWVRDPGGRADRVGAAARRRTSMSMPNASFSRHRRHLRSCTRHPTPGLRSACAGRDL